jgi:KDO2-lipid IV(A) lauroyltransferase
VTIRSLRYVAEDAALRLSLALSSLVPRGVLLGAGSVAGWIGYALDRRHRRIALRNVELAYGSQIDPRGARRLVRNSWRHFGRITLDSFTIFRSPLAKLERLIEYEGLEHIRKAYDRGKGVLLFSAHYGHWELTALMQGHMNLPLVLITRPLDNPRLERMLARLRERSGNRVIHKRSAVPEMLRALRERMGVAIVIDQDARGEGVFVPFFGRPASTTPTLALLALRTGAAVVPTFSIPRPDGTYRIVYEPEIEVLDTGNRDRDILELTATCTAVIEKWVRRHPELWLWMHRRWKTEPPAGQSRD